MGKILSAKAREILDSRGNPTVESTVATEDGIFTSAVPSGASTGKYEALELRDGDKKRYNGKGVLKAVSNVNDILSKAIIGKDPVKQKEIDELMNRLDGTENKSRLGANAILGVSMSVCRAGAAAKKIPLYKHIAEISGVKEIVMPVPMILVIEGGKHADNSSDLQEFMIMPYKAKGFADALKIGSVVYDTIGELLKKQGFDLNIGFEGAYGPSLGTNEKALQIIIGGIKKAGCKINDIFIAIDSAASELFDNEKYSLKSERKILDSREIIEFYGALCKKYPIISIEDGLAEDDWTGWALLTKKLGSKIQIVGDDLTVTNAKRLQKAIDEKAINSVLIKLNQIGTVSETINAVNLAKKNGLTCVISHRSGETEDSFIADLAVGASTGQCKFGAPSKSERLAKYNRLLEIEKELGKNAIYAGKNFRKLLK